MIDLRGQSTWAHVPKRPGETILLLHGGMSSSASLLDSIGPGLKKNFRVAAFDRRGHGRSPDNERPFHYADMARETIAFIEYMGRRVHLVGHSDGGIVALLTVLERPDLVDRAVLIGANFHYRGLLPVTPMREDSPEFAAWAEQYALSSPDGITHAPQVYRKSMRLFTHEPRLHREELTRVTRPVLVMAGDDDVAKLSHTCTMYESIPGAQLAVVAGTSHSVLKEKTKLCVTIIEDFLTSPWPPETRAPMRRNQGQREVR